MSILGRWPWPSQPEPEPRGVTPSEAPDIKPQIIGQDIVAYQIMGEFARIHKLLEAGKRTSYKGEVVHFQLGGELQSFRRVFNQYFELGPRQLWFYLNVGTGFPYALDEREKRLGRANLFLLDANILQSSATHHMELPTVAAALKYLREKLPS